MSFTLCMVYLICMKHTPFTLEDIAVLMDQKLQPIKDDLSLVRTDLSKVKEVVEREFKLIRQDIQRVEGKIDLLDQQVAESGEYYEERFTKLEKRTGVSV